MMRLARSVMVIVILVVAGISVLYFLSPLGLGGHANDKTVKVSSLLMNDWDNIGVVILSYNLFHIDGINVAFLQENTWWMFGLLAFSTIIMIAFLGFKSKWPYIFIGFLAILVALVASFVAGGFMLILSIIGILNHAYWKLSEENKVDYSYLYREYID